MSAAVLAGVLVRAAITTRSAVAAVAAVVGVLAAGAILALGTPGLRRIRDLPRPGRLCDYRGVQATTLVVVAVALLSVCVLAVG